MRYQPHPDEVAATAAMSHDELLEYFLYRIFETDEVWTLKEDGQPILGDVGDQQTLPVWAYQCFAEQAAVGGWANLQPAADSVDFFTYQLLNRVARQDLAVDIMPRPGVSGCVIGPQQLFGLLENMMEAREQTVGD